MRKTPLAIPGEGLGVCQWPLPLDPNEILKCAHFALKRLHDRSQAAVLDLFNAMTVGTGQSAIVAKCSRLSRLGVETAPKSLSNCSKVLLKCSDVVEFVRD